VISGQQQLPPQQRLPYGIETNMNQHNSEAWIGNSPPIQNGPPTCPLDSLLLDFLHERRQRAAEGVNPQDIIGPRYPSVSSLLNPANSSFSHPLSKVFTDSKHISDLPNLPRSWWSRSIVSSGYTGFEIAC
jgi:hypothetical protein